MYIMKRYQVYLNPQSVSIIDAFGKEVKLSRSRILQMMVDSVAGNLSKLLVTRRNKRVKGALDDIVGSITIKGKKKTDFAQNIDEIYLRD
jgi:hypothetical protein